MGAYASALDQLREAVSHSMWYTGSFAAHAHASLGLHTIA